MSASSNGSDVENPSSAEDGCHPPDCECGRCPFVEPAALMVRSFEREMRAVVGSLRPAERAVLVKRGLLPTEG